MAERVCQEYFDRCDIIIVRPRFIWGYGDTVVLPELIAASKSFLGFTWIGGAEYLTSTCNVSNVVHVMILATERGRPGEAYFLTDDESILQKDFLSRLFETQDIDPSRFGSTSLTFAQFIAWSGLIPQLSKTSLSLLAQEITVSVNKAKSELNYRPIITPREGLEELRRDYESKNSNK